MKAEMKDNKGEKGDWVKTVTRVLFVLALSPYHLITLSPVFSDPPKRVKDGIEFSYKEPNAKSVHLAGSFNDWAENQEGKVTKPEYLMRKGADGVWRKTIPLSPGQYAYKFVIDGSNWSADPNNSGPRDKDDNSLFTVK